MVRANTEALVTQSVLDRLMDVEDWPTTRAQSLRYFREALKRDVEWLLNTRRPPLEHIDRFERARATMVNYGLSDITALGLSSASDQKRLRKALEQCLHEFEPRLTGVVVTLQESQTADRRLRFHVQGLMRVNPAPEEISFDTVLELSSGEYTVK
ncbi:MAG: type secretion system lysozyme-related protein [Bryobacterales bacterium]|nr:type secretion system lysozyme-related protein [Bryobacterales bacterium]